MSRIYLIRHGENDYSIRGALAGRLRGVHLNEIGRGQAERLAGKLASARIDRIFSSPLERCRETAEPLAHQLQVKIEISDQLVELDFGEWTGLTFAELEPSDTWRRFNRLRSVTRIPGGELMAEAQTRIIGFIQNIRHRHPDETVAVVTHGDIIRGALLFYLGMPLDFVHRLRIDPASFSILSLTPQSIEVETMNRT